LVDRDAARAVRQTGFVFKGVPGHEGHLNS
jgi:hypothetical protein